MWFQYRAVALKIDALAVISGKNPVSAGLLQAAAQRSLLIAARGRAGGAGVLALSALRLAVGVSIDSCAIRRSGLVRSIALGAWH